MQRPLGAVLRLQALTIAWMLAECGLALYAAVEAQSPALLAFGSDSLVELLSAGFVLLQFLPEKPVTERTAGRVNGALLMVLAAVVAATALASLRMGRHPESSLLGIGVTLAALAVMPVLAWLKRREARRRQNAALAADAVQSAACAYLALITLAGLALHSIFDIAWFDSAAALAAVPLLWREGREAWHGRGCGCAGGCHASAGGENAPE